MKFTSSQPLWAHCNSTIIYFYQCEENVTQFVKVLIVKLSVMLHLSNFVRLFHHQSFTLYGMWPLQWVINMDGSGKFLKCCSSTAMHITVTYYLVSTSCWVEPTAEGLIKSVLPFLRTKQSTSFGAHFHDYHQYLTFTCSIS